MEDSGDQARIYQLAAMFVVSRRTTLDYTRCFNTLMTRFRDVRARSVKVEFIVGDAEDAQYTAIQAVPELGGEKVLMCLFYVLYNVRKKIRHLGVQLRKQVMIRIMEMHFSLDLQDYHGTRDRTLLQWRETTGLASFATYFENQWLAGRYWRGQAFHTPAGFAATNNPCEIFNASLKSYLQRRRCHMELLLRKLSEVIDVTPVHPPAAYHTLAQCGRIDCWQTHAQWRKTALGDNRVTRRRSDLPRRADTLIDASRSREWNSFCPESK